MAIFGNPKVLYASRVVQLLFGILFLVLICYDGTHRAWWNSINGPLAVGVISSIFTFAITVLSIYSHHRSNPFSGGSTIYSIARLANEVVVLLLWVASAALMLRPRGECYSKGPLQEGRWKGVTACANNDREGNVWKWRYDWQPIKTWDTAIAVSLIEA
ncbi:MAG: hypothetical protein Q9220_004124 [cf. Caloplaca sp. 1 TL-2023]